MHKSLQQALVDLSFDQPTPIQAQAIPPALEGRDLLACAMTGSGKTLAFLLPILDQIIERKRGTTRALVVTPTRELAAQILDELKSAARHTNVTGAAIYGGVGMGPQEAAFRKGVDIMVATPGRLLDHLGSPYGKLDSIEYLVLDEADRMLDMGFLPDIRRVLARLPAKRQTLFFSATMPQQIVSLTRELLKDPVSIDLQRRSAPATGIKQAIYPVPQELKSALLQHLLAGDHMEDVLVFTRTKHRADRLAKQLVARGVAAERIHGNRSQPQRTQALAGFKDGTYRVLVATDIMARGIDISELGHVINFDVPPAPEDYIHRVGRTGRAAATGDAFTFVAPDEEDDIRRIEKVVGKKIERIKVPDFDYSATPEGKLEIPIGERIAKIKAERAAARARQKEKESRKAGSVGAARTRTERPAAPSSGGGNSARRGRGPRRGGGRNGS